MLGPRPGVPSAQAYYDAPSAPPQPQAPSWDQAALISVLNNMSLQGSPTAPNWVMDTGASTHVSNHGNLTSLSPSTSSSRILVGNGSSIPVSCTGSSTIATSSHPLHLHDLLVAPKLIENLLSIHQLTRDNLISVEFDPRGFSIKDLHTKVEILRCNSDGDLYPLAALVARTLLATAASRWHQRLGHPGNKALSQVLSSFDFTCNKDSSSPCNACRLGKHTRLPFSSSNTVISAPFQLLHCDVWTSLVPNVSGFQFYLAILDDYTHFVWVYPLRQKSEVAPIITFFCTYIQNQFSRPVHYFQSDNGREFENHALRSFFFLLTGFFSDFLSPVLRNRMERLNGSYEH
jgi:hypothetical protein